ncbi:MAG: arylamine N-acetyltransferase [Leptolyngbya sp. SIO1E4]|nr:arylamine N-acetyltransferase [Leptolyngbya sp. SIO1E4]
MEVRAYLERIGYGESQAPTIETLRQLHRAHLLAVPFENLDIPLGSPIVLSLPALYDKIVCRGRGGFCYELNGLFGWLLEQLGFPVTLLSARVFNGRQPGPEFDHLLLLIETEAGWIADVGFGDSFLEPLGLTQAETMQQGRTYRLVGPDTAKVLQRRSATEWEPQYVFSLTPRRLADFNTLCHHQQTASTSAFTQKAVCSRATQQGRITLSNNRLIVTTAGQREEHAIATEAEYQTLLRQHFGISLGKPLKMWRH